MTEPTTTEELTISKGSKEERMTEPDKNRLSTKQENAIDLLITGATDKDVAEAVGVTRQTICGWRNEHAEFQAALNRRRQEVWGMAPRPPSESGGACARSGGRGP